VICVCTTCLIWRRARPSRIWDGVSCLATSKSANTPCIAGETRTSAGPWACASNRIITSFYSNKTHFCVCKKTDVPVLDRLIERSLQYYICVIIFQSFDYVFM
jgi:hypothetical protein